MSTKNLLPTLAALALALVPGEAPAQAWGPARGEAGVFVGYTNVYNRYHFNAAGEELDRGRTTTHVVSADLSYGITDRLAVRLALPYVTAKYEGAFPHVMPGHDVVDTGSYHGGLQDVRF